MYRWSWKIGVRLTVVIGAVALGVGYMAAVREPRSFFDYLVLDLAFLPFQVALVSVFVERLLQERERQTLLHKLNMVVGVLFSEIGSELLREITAFCQDSPDLYQRLRVTAAWKARDYQDALAYARKSNYHLDPQPVHLEQLRAFLSAKTPILLSLLQNPNLLEHQGITDLLWAITHLAEELRAHNDLSQLPAADLTHLRGDLARAYGHLIRQWLAYMEHLHRQYPYIHSLAIRLSPFQPKPSAVIYTA